MDLRCLIGAVWSFISLFSTTQPTPEYDAEDTADRVHPQDWYNKTVCGHKDMLALSTASLLPFRQMLVCLPAKGEVEVEALGLEEGRHESF